MHPLVLELTGKKSPQTGLEGKFSVYHAAAVAISRRGGRAAVQRPGGKGSAGDCAAGSRRRHRGRSIAEDQVRIVITLKDQARFEKYIEHAVGSARNPMTDAQLEAKVSGLTEGVLPRDRTRRVMDLCWHVADLRDVAQLAQAASA